MREYIWLECSECSNRNYRTSKETRGGSKLELKKFCKFCRKHSVHKERKK